MNNAATAWVNIEKTDILPKPDKDYWAHRQPNQNWNGHTPSRYVMVYYTYERHGKKFGHLTQSYYNPKLDYWVGINKDCKIEYWAEMIAPEGTEQFTPFTTIPVIEPLKQYLSTDNNGQAYLIL